MHKSMLAAFAFVLSYLFCLTSRAEDDGFVPVDPATLNTVSGKNLMIASYVVIIGILFLYVLVLVLRDKKIGHSVEALKHQLRK